MFSGSGCRVYGSRFRIQAVGFKVDIVQSLGFRVLGFGFSGWA